jgi:glycosyltransferase involved in cell wall biosynthesis
LRIAVVSPFVDRRHGTERAVAELIERLAATYRCEVHLFAQSVADIDVSPADSASADRSSTGSIQWHRVGAIRGPQLFRFSAWFFLNRLHRLWGDFDLVLSPGINCADADVVIVHALFHQLSEVGSAASYRLRSPGFLRAMHRKLYYRLMSILERHIYTDRRVTLAAVSHRTARLMARYFGRRDVSVVHNAVDSAFFSPESRLARRDRSRSEQCLEPHELVLLMIGNDWMTKGIHTIFEAMTMSPKIPLRLLVVGSDAREPYLEVAAKLGVLDRCIWRPWGVDVLDCYAAADVYVSPSREDAFSLPVLEAMACGLPAITSASAGSSEVVTHGVDAIVLQDPRDAPTLAQHIAKLHRDPSFRSAIGEAAALAARNWTWEAHAAAIWQLLEEVNARKSGSQQDVFER